MYHLLLVDDEDITLDRLRSTIRWDTLGIGEVSVAYSMMQAQRVYQAKPVDIMICDIEMPAGSGIELVRWVRENGYHTLNIFLTAHADFEYIHEALAMQAIEYILKPIAFEEVENAVRKAVALADSASMKSRSDLQLYFEMLLQGSGDSVYRSLQN
ncbi:MAG: response regulator, partial [Christensenellales bacterium]